MRTITIIFAGLIISTAAVLSFATPPIPMTGRIHAVAGFRALVYAG